MQDMKRMRDLDSDARLLEQEILNSIDEQYNRKQLNVDDKAYLDLVYQRLVEEGGLVNGLSGIDKYSSKEGYVRFVKAIEAYPRKVKYNFTRAIMRFGVAASILLMLGVFSYLYYLNNNSHQPQIGPGMAKSTMVLSNGKILKASTKNFTYVNNDFNIKYQKGSFFYDTKSKPDSLYENTLYVPRGGEANIILSDGTKVWLNSDSYLKHPVAFMGDTREVTLEGQAYFEVSKDTKHPFVVHMQKGDVAVYGTSFGITSYEQETAYVTLEHGKISFKAKDKDELFLSPGEQVVIDENGIQKRNTVNVKEYVGWKDGLFTFNNKRLEDIMHILERWYDVQVAFKDPSLKEIRFNGDLKRYDSINVLLEALYLTKELGYSIEEKTITLYQE